MYLLHSNMSNGGTYVSAMSQVLKTVLTYSPKDTVKVIQASQIKKLVNT